MSETTAPSAIPLATSERYPCCDPATCSGCGCCADEKKAETPSCC